MDRLKSVASEVLASGKEHLGKLAAHGPAAVMDGVGSYRERVHADAGAMLPSWNDTPTRDAITGFVETVSTPGSPHFVPEAERIAVFDNDGTLWPEKPLVIQLDFTIKRFAEAAAADPGLRERQPYKAAFTHDLAWFNEAVVKHYQGDDADLGLLMQALPQAFAGMTIEDYLANVREFFSTATHPTLKRPYATLGYQPMVELLRYLEAHGFTVYIASGGDRDFMRGVAEEIYGIPPERIVGSSLKLEFREHEDHVDVLYQAEMDFFDDGPEKPVRIWSRIGRRPVFVGGNSNGDIPMMRFANVAGRPSFRLLVRHDDEDREFTYDKGAEAALQRAAERDWTVVSMKDDWATVFVEQPPTPIRPVVDSEAGDS